MIHFSCDRCKRVLDPEDDVRYVVRLEIYAALEPVDVDEVEDDRDHLVEIQEMLEQIDDETIGLGDEAYQKQRFDLCSDCYKEYIRNPVGREIAAHLDFSQN